MSSRVELSPGWTRDTVFFEEIKDWSGIFALNTFGIRASEERSLKRAFSDVVIGDRIEEVFIVIFDCLATHDPVGSFEVGDVFVIAPLYALKELAKLIDRDE
jgi:hypothetical protein